MNKEIRYNDVKQKNGQVTICLRFYAKNGSDVYLPIYVKAIKPTKAEIKKYGTFEYGGEDVNGDGGISECCRINLTKWHVLGAPEISKKYVKNLIGKDLWCYYNGAEVSWKFFDPDGDVDKKNAKLYIIKNKITDQIIESLQEACINCYEPHNDSKKNYGDESIHAVYDFLKTQNKKGNMTKNVTNPRMPNDIAKINVTNMCKKILAFTDGYESEDYVKGSEPAKKLHNLMNVFRTGRNSCGFSGSGKFRTGHGMKTMEKLADML